MIPDGVTWELLGFLFAKDLVVPLVFLRESWYNFLLLSLLIECYLSYEVLVPVDWSWDVMGLWNEVGSFHVTCFEDDG